MLLCSTKDRWLKESELLCMIGHCCVRQDCSQLFFVRRASQITFSTFETVVSDRRPLGAFSKNAITAETGHSMRCRQQCYVARGERQGWPSATSRREGARGLKYETIFLLNFTMPQD